MENYKTTDITASYVYTPEGVGKYVDRDPVTDMILLEMDFAYRVWFLARDCYLD